MLQTKNNRWYTTLMSKLKSNKVNNKILCKDDVWEKDHKQLQCLIKVQKSKTYIQTLNLMNNYYEPTLKKMKNKNRPLVQKILIKNMFKWYNTHSNNYKLNNIEYKDHTSLVDDIKLNRTKAKTYTNINTFFVHFFDDEDIPLAMLVNK